MAVVNNVIVKRLMNQQYITDMKSGFLTVLILKIANKMSCRIYTPPFPS